MVMCRGQWHVACSQMKSKIPITRNLNSDIKSKLCILRYQHGEPARYQDPQPPTPININSEEFPTLGGQAPVLPVQPTRRKQPQEAFPALGPVDISTTSNSGGGKEDPG
jgi:hypothetical protein